MSVDELCDCEHYKSQHNSLDESVAICMTESCECPRFVSEADSDEAFYQYVIKAEEAPYIQD